MAGAAGVTGSVAVVPGRVVGAGLAAARPLPHCDPGLAVGVADEVHDGSAGEDGETRAPGAGQAGGSLAGAVDASDVPAHLVSKVLEAGARLRGPDSSSAETLAPQLLHAGRTGERDAGAGAGVDAVVATVRVETDLVAADLGADRRAMC